MAIGSLPTAKVWDSHQWEYLIQTVRTSFLWMSVSLIYDDNSNLKGVYLKVYSVTAGLIDMKVFITTSWIRAITASTSTLFATKYSFSAARLLKEVTSSHKSEVPFVPSVVFSIVFIMHKLVVEFIYTVIGKMNESVDCSSSTLVSVSIESVEVRERLNTFQ